MEAISRDGVATDVLFFFNRNVINAVEVKAGGSTFEAGTVRELFDTGLGGFPGGHPYSPYGVAADGQRFLIQRPAATATENGPSTIAVVVNWAEGLRK